MASNDLSKTTSQVISQTDIGQSASSLPSLQTNIKWKYVCEENAKLVAEKLFNSLFIDHSISIPPDLTLSIIIEQFYQILRDKLKELVQHKISDWEIRYPSLLLAASGTLSIKNENEANKDSNSSSLGFPSTNSEGNLSSNIFMVSWVIIYLNFLSVSNPYYAISIHCRK